nr:MAG TPA: Toll-like receptor 3 domain, dimer, IMMUNE SYSTEM [Caudoviricetes sp.]
MTGAPFELISSLVVVAFIIIAVAVSKSGYKE